MKLRRLALIAALAAVYFAVGRLGLSFASVNQSATAVWPPTGIAIAVLLVLGPELWPGVAIGAFLVNLVTSGSLLASLAIAGGNTLEALVAEHLVTRFAAGARSFDRASDVLRFSALAGLIATAIAATMGVGTLLATGLADRGTAPLIWFTWWMGDAGGALVIGPALIVLWSDRRPWIVRHLGETLLALAALVVAAMIVFGGWEPAMIRHYPLTFLCLPFVLWPALRIGQREAAVSVLALTSIAVWGTLRGHGPFGAFTISEALLLVQTFSIVVAVTTAAMAAVVAERQRLQLEEEAARREAEEASRLKDQFLAVVSHELRTPLNAILGWSHMLANSSLDAEAASRAVLVIERNARAQARLIDDLLDVSRFAGGQVRLTKQPVDLRSIVRAAVESIEPSARAGGVRLKASMDGPPAIVDGDPGRLQQIASNLLSNAVKFTPEGGNIHVSLTARGRVAEFDVSDSGAGIARESLPRVFEPFWQADTSTTKSTGGLGLGLAIVKYLVEAHGGTIRVDSPGVGQGAVFTVVLPLV